MHRFALFFPERRIQSCDHNIKIIFPYIHSCNSSFQFCKYDTSDGSPVIYPVALILRQFPLFYIHCVVKEIGHYGPSHSVGR